jgi:hypothetical protein
MPENVRMWVEISFNVTYLVVVWSLVVMMWRRRSTRSRSGAVGLCTAGRG